MVTNCLLGRLRKLLLDFVRFESTLAQTIEPTVWLSLTTSSLLFSATTHPDQFETFQLFTLGLWRPSELSV